MRALRFACRAKDMEGQRIARRLVYHAMAKEYNPRVGNGRLIRELARHSHLSCREVDMALWSRDGELEV